MILMKVVKDIEQINKRIKSICNEKPCSSFPCFEQQALARAISSSACFLLSAGDLMLGSVQGILFQIVSSLEINSTVSSLHAPSLDDFLNSNCVL